MQDYTTIIGVITMRGNNCSFSVIQNRYYIGSSTVQLILKRFEQSGLSIEQLKELTPEELERIFYPPDNLRKKNLPYPDFQLYYDKMHLKDSKVNLSYCWIDYRQKHPDGCGQSQFYDLYRAFEEKNYGKRNTRMAVERNSGEKMYIDWIIQKPVYINDDLFGSTFRRNHEGDYRCTRLQVKTMIRDQAENTMDMEVLDDVQMGDLNYEMIKGYRNRHRTLNPGHPFERLKIENDNRMILIYCM